MCVMSDSLVPIIYKEELELVATEFLFRNYREALRNPMVIKPQELAEHIYWYNNQRIHGSLDYMTPIEYKELNNLKRDKVS